MFRSQLFDHLQGGPSFVLSDVTTFSAYLRRQVVYLVCGCNVVYVCACVPDVLVCGMFGYEHNQTSHRQVHQAHTHRQHTK
jgi:hypothetical protein